jgi:hypothetical protein
MPRLHEVAIHEAGHALAGLLSGKEYGAVIHKHDDGGLSGTAGPGELNEPPNPDNYKQDRLAPQFLFRKLPELLTEAVIYAAGCTAVALAQFEREVYVTAGDRELITATARQAFTETDFEVERAWAQLAITQARVLLVPRMETVERIAAALEERGRLTAAEVAALAVPTACKRGED